MDVTDSFQEETFRMETKLYANLKNLHIQESDSQSYQKKKTSVKIFHSQNQQVITFCNQR